MQIKRGMSKKAQFYIIAAVIIIAVLVGVFALTNYAKIRKGYIKIYDLGDELGVETGYVYDHGIYNGTDINDLIDQWTDAYLEYTKEQEVIENWIFVYGNLDEMTAATLTTQVTGEIEIIIGGGSTGVEITEKKTKKEHIPVSGEKVWVKFQDLTYEFELEEGENFFFIISSEEFVSRVETEGG